MPPKKPLTAFFLFKEDYWKQVKDDNPTLKMTEIGKIMCEKWAKADQQTIAYYEAKIQEARELYEQDMKLYESQ